MKILYISTSPLEYSASSNMRNVALLKGLIENGCKIYTLTPEAQKDSNLYDDTLCNIRITKKYYINMGKLHSAVTIKKNNRKGLKNKIKTYLYNKLKKIRIYDFRSSLSKQKILIDEQFDIIISSSDPKSSHLMAKSVLKNNPQIAKRWIQYWGDPFADDINDNRKMFRFFVKREEEKLIRACDEVVYVSPFTLEKQKKMFPKYRDKMFFLPIPYNQEVIYKPTNNKQLTIGYFGNYYEKNRNILPIYNLVKKNSNFRLLVCGGSDVGLKQESNMIIEDRQSIQKIKEYEEQSDVLVCICNSSGTQIPGKVYHYSATNKPILVILDGEYQEELKKYFDTFERYILCYNNEESILDALKKIEKDNMRFLPCSKLCAKNISIAFIDKGEKKYESN